MAALSPTATMRPSRTATAWAMRDLVSRVTTLALWTIRSGGASARAARGAQHSRSSERGDFMGGPRGSRGKGQHTPRRRVGEDATPAFGLFSRGGLGDNAAELAL